MEMFDPHYASRVFEDILTRQTGREWKFILTPKEPKEASPQQEDTKSA